MMLGLGQGLVVAEEAYVFSWVDGVRDVGAGKTNTLTAVLLTTDDAV